ncbi:hypothetical protein D9M68_931100 [compost metagenome]
MRQFVQQRLRGVALFVVGEVDAAAVLRAHVVALAVGRGRIVDHEEDLQDLACADDGRVVFELHDFVAAGAAGAHVFITRSFGLAVAVAGLDVGDAAHLFVDGLGAPEAAAAEHDGR